MSRKRRKCKKASELPPAVIKAAQRGFSVACKLLWDHGLSHHEIEKVFDIRLNRGYAAMKAEHRRMK